MKSAELPTLRQLLIDGTLERGDEFCSVDDIWLQVANSYDPDDDPDFVCVGVILVNDSIDEFQAWGWAHFCDLQPGAEFSVDPDTPVQEYVRYRTSEEHVECDRGAVEK